MEIFKKTNFDFLGKKWPFIILSLLLTAAGVGSLIVKGGPKYGIDFTGGALMDVNFTKRPSAEAIRAALHKKISGEIEVQEVSNTQNVGASQEVLITTGATVTDQNIQTVRGDIVSALNTSFNSATSSGKLDINLAGQTELAGRLRDALAQTGAGLSDDQLDALVKRIIDYRSSHSGLIHGLDELSSVPGVTSQVLNVIKQQCFAGNFAIRSAEVVGPKIGADLRQQAINVVLIALAAMLVYIAFRFEWIYGVAAVIAVFHDTIITIGLFSLFNKPIDLTVIAALLTLVGYSMNDTIVTFDRIRENLRMQMRGTFEHIVNVSINQTLSRTVLTSGLTFLTAISLYLFGGQVLNGFSFALVVGIIVGTYSSIFIASPILVFWQDLSEGRRKRARAVTETRPRNVASTVKTAKPVKTAK
jgi:preprotein translocase subunit SecF